MNLVFSVVKSVAVAIILGIIPGAALAEAPFRIAFGSCNRQDRPQPLWTAILENKPDLWIWCGDNIYGDTVDMEVMEQKYALQNQNDGYRQLASMTKVIGTWDDHDYGQNNAGMEYPMKKESQSLLLDFLKEPANSSRRNQEGVYASYEFGRGTEKVKVILLDCRYHREQPSPDADILGEAQWEWLSRELHRSDAAVNIVVSGIQVVAKDQRYEKWGQFPAARDGLFALIRNSGAKNVLFLSGDRHQAEISGIQIEGMPEPLYDITSSGLTHVAKGNTGEPNRHRIAGPVAELNFGLITLDWESKPAMMHLEIRGLENRVLLEKKIPLAGLK